MGLPSEAGDAWGGVGDAHGTREVLGVPSGALGGRKGCWRGFRGCWRCLGVLAVLG